MGWLRIAALGLVAITSLWMIFDGSRALVVGDYVTPRSGDYAGKLGPWAALLEAIRIPPRSTAVKVAFVVLGLAWIASAAIALWTGSTTMLLIVSIACIWYAPFGTLAAIVALVSCIAGV